MGADARITVRCKACTDELRCSESLDVIWQDNKPTRNFNVIIYERYFSEDYPRGHWPSLAKVLLELLKDKSVEAIYYGSDEMSPDSIPKFTLDRFNQLTKFYVES